MDFALDDRLDTISKEDLQNVFVNKIKKGPEALIRSISGKKYVVGRLWDFNRYILFAVMPPDDLKTFERFERKYGHPFPGLIKENEVKPAFIIESQNNSFGEFSFIVGDNAVFEVHSDATFYVYSLNIQAVRFGGPLSYVTPLLFCISFGQKIRRYAMADVFEGMVSKYINDASGYKIAYD